MPPQAARDAAKVGRGGGLRVQPRLLGIECVDPPLPVLDALRPEVPAAVVDGNIEPQLVQLVSLDTSLNKPVNVLYRRLEFCRAL